METTSNNKSTKSEREKRYETKKDERNHSAMHITSFVLGLISILTGFFWYIALPTSILAIVFGTKSIHRTGSKLGKAGLILGIVGLSFFVMIYCFIIFVSLLSYI